MQHFPSISEPKTPHKRRVFLLNITMGDVIENAPDFLALLKQGNRSPLGLVTRPASETSRRTYVMENWEGYSMPNLVLSPAKR